MDNNTLLNMGFNNSEIEAYYYIINNGGKITPMWLQRYGFNIQDSKRLCYLHKCVTGEVNVGTENEVIAHVAKMGGLTRADAKQQVYLNNIHNKQARQRYSKDELINRLRATYGKTKRISIQDLQVSSVSSIPRVAVIDGIEQEPYNIWNSRNYKGKQSLYKVTDVSGQRITVETNIKPKLKYGEPKELKGVLEIVGVKQNGNAVVAFDKSVAKLCNRYIIIASLRRPEFHLGMFEIICYEGTKVYVYAADLGTKESVSYKGGTQRVYAFGIFHKDLRGKLDSVAKDVFKRLRGVCSEYNGATDEFRVVPIDKEEAIDGEDY